MKKTGIAIAAMAMLLAASVTTSYVVGGKLQEGLLQSAPTWNKPPLAMEVLGYERGLFTSTAQTQWTLSTGDDQVQFTAQHTIWHGPWPRGHAAEITSTFAVDSNAPPAWITAYKNKAPLVWHTTLGWGKRSRHTLTSPAFNGNFDGDKVRFGGLEADFEIPGDLQGIKGTARLPSLALQPAADGHQRSALELGASTLRFDIQQAPGYGFLVGSVHWGLESLLSTASDQKKRLQIAGLTLDTHTVAHTEVVNTTLNTRIQNLVTEDSQISDITLELGLHNLDAAWLNQLSQASQAGQADPQALHNALQGALPQLLARKPELEIKRARWRTAEGDGEITATLAYHGNPSDSASPLADLKASLQLSMPQASLQALMRSRLQGSYQERQAGADGAAAPEQLAPSMEKEAEDRLRSLVQAGIVLNKEQRLSTQLNYSDGKLQANGKVLNDNEVMDLLHALP